MRKLILLLSLGLAGFSLLAFDFSAPGSPFAVGENSDAIHWNEIDAEFDRLQLLDTIAEMETAELVNIILATELSSLAQLNTLISAALADGAHTSDTTAATVCSGVTTYLNGEASCIDLTTVFEVINTDIAQVDEVETLTADWVNVTFPWLDAEVSNTLTLGTGSSISDTTIVLMEQGAADPLTDGEMEWDTATETLKIGDDGATTKEFFPGAHISAEVNDLESNDPPSILDDEIYVGTGSASGAFAALSACAAGTEAVRWTGTAFTCDTITAPAPGFDEITSGTNTSGVMVVGTGGAISVTGSGTVVATSGDSASNFFVSGTINDLRMADSHSNINGLVSSSRIILEERGGADPTADGDIEWDTTTETIKVGDDAAATLEFHPGAHTADTNANTACSGTDTYYDGEGNCDDISALYEPLDTAIPRTNVAETLTSNWVNTANPWADNEVANDLTLAGGAVATTDIVLEEQGAADPTVDGDIEWDSTTETLKVGDDGAATKEFFPNAHFTPNTDPSVDHASYVAGHTNGANCAAGEVPLGVDASGVVEGCYEPVEADISDLDHTDTSKLPLAGGTLTGEVVVDDLGLEFAAGDALTDCSTYSATGGGIYYDDSEGKFKKCQDNVLTDLATPVAEVNDLETDDPPNILDDEVYVGTSTGVGLFTALQNCTDGTQSLDWDGSAFVCNAITAGGTIDVQEEDSSVEATADTLDFGAGFDVTSAPGGEANVVLDYTEDPVDLATAEVTGTLAVGNGGTGATSLTNLITSVEVLNDSLLEADLDLSDSPADNEILTYNLAGLNFSWDSISDLNLATTDTTQSITGLKTFTKEVTLDDLGAEFIAGDALTDCSTFGATNGGIFFDDSEGVFKKCQDNVLTDLDPAAVASDGSIPASGTLTQCLPMQAAAAKQLSTGTATIGTVDGTNFAYNAIQLDSSTDETVNWEFDLPASFDASGVVTATYTWTNDTGATSTVCLGFQTASFANDNPFRGATLGAFSGATDTSTASDDLMVSPSVTITESWAADEHVVFTATRDVDGGGTGCSADAMGEDMHLLVVDLCFEVDNAFSGE